MNPHSKTRESMRRSLAERLAAQREAVAQLPTSTEAYKTLELADRMAAASRVLARYAPLSRDGSIREGAHRVEMDSDEEIEATLMGYAGYHQEQSVNVLNSTQVTREAAIEVLVELTSHGVSTGFYQLGEVRFRPVWGDRDPQSSERELLGNEPIFVNPWGGQAIEGEDMVEVVDAAVCDIIDTRLTKERQALGAIAVTAPSV